MEATYTMICINLLVLTYLILGRVGYNAASHFTYYKELIRYTELFLIWKVEKGFFYQFFINII